MKRKNFQITYANVTVIKHTWNAAGKEVVRIIGEIAKQEQTNYRCVGGITHRVDSHCLSGSRIWVGDNGRTVEFEIQLLVE